MSQNLIVSIMSRQLKFRAWNAEQNKMIFTFDGEYKIMVNSKDGTVFCGGHLPTGDWNEPPLMQFIGLTDKIGNEIFEGDIVKTNSDKAMVISWSDRHASFVLIKEGLAIRHFGDGMVANECEIVGNVYENWNVLQHQA